MQTRRTCVREVGKRLLIEHLQKPNQCVSDIQYQDNQARDFERFWYSDGKLVIHHLISGWHGGVFLGLPDCRVPPPPEFLISKESGFGHLHSFNLQPWMRIDGLPMCNQTAHHVANYAEMFLGRGIKGINLYQESAGVTKYALKFQAYAAMQML